MPSAAYLAAMSGNVAPDYTLALNWSSPLNARLLAAGNFGGSPGTDLAALGQEASSAEYRVFLFVQGDAGTLQPPLVISLPAGMRGISVVGFEPGDFNEDGRTDLVLTNRDMPGVFLLLSGPAGTYEWRSDDWTNLPVRVTGKVADFDRDGHLDVVTSGGFDTDWIRPIYPERRLFYFGDGLGNFTRHRADEANGDAYALAVGDFDGNGTRDIAEGVVGIDAQPHVRVHRNDGTGAFLSPTTLDGRELVEFAPGLLDGADFTGDLLDDVVLGDGDHLLVHAQSPDGSIQRIATRFGAWAYIAPRIADLDGNGLPDAVHPSDYAPAAVRVYLQDEYGLRHARKFPFAVNGTPSQFAASAFVTGDFNGDNVSDVAVATPSQGIYLLRGSLVPYTGAGSVPGAPSVGTPVLQAGTSFPNYRVDVGVGPPASTGGEPVTGYSVFSVPSGAVDVDAGTAATTHRLYSLAENTRYTFYARAHNAAGLGPPSAISTALVLGTPEDPARAPRLRIDWQGQSERDVESYAWPFTVRLDRPAPPGGVTFEVWASDGTATAGQDYAFASPGTVTIPEGLMASAPLALTLIGDLLDEPDETLVVHLANVQHGDAPAYTGTMTIYDDDTPDTRIAIGGARVQEGNAGVQTAYATVRLSQPSPTPVTFAVSSFCYMCDYYDGIVEHQRFWRQSYTIPAGETSVQVPVQFDGDTRYENDEYIDVYLESASVTFAYDNSARVYMLNDDSAPTLSIGDASVVEGNQGPVALKFTASLSAPVQKDVEFTIRTADGSAREGTDYVARHAGALKIVAGQTHLDFVVQGVGDVAAEADESFTVRLEDVRNVAAADGVGVGTLRNDDQPNALSVDDAQVVEGNGGYAQLVFNVRLSEPSATPVTFDILPSTGTAFAPDDFLANPGNARVIPAGSTLATFTVPVVGDTVVEDDETLVVELANVVGAIVGKGQGRGRILNDDLPTLAIADVTVTEPDEGHQVSAFFLVTLSARTSTPVVFEASIAPGGTASPGYDHAYAPRPYAYFSSSPPPTVFTIDAGRTSKLVEVWVFGDNVPESTESFKVQLKAISGATIADGSATGTILDNDAPAVTASTSSPTTSSSVAARIAAARSRPAVAAGTATASTEREKRVYQLLP